MLTYERTVDYGLVRSIITHPTQYQWAGDDFSPPAAEFKPNEDERIWYVLAMDGEKLMGMMMFLPQSSVCWEVHCCLLPACWGRTTEAARGAFAFLFRHTQAQRIVANIAAYNKLAIRLAVRSGMEMFGANRASWLRNGELHDQLCFGISKT